MKYLFVVFETLLVLAFMAKLSLAAAIDYQKMADEAKWEFKLDKATILTSFLESHGEYVVTLISPPSKPGELTISISSHGIKKYEWIGHGYSPFKIVGDDLYYALFNPIGTGADLVAVDLASGNQRWRSAVKGLGGVEHSAYANRLNLMITTDAIIVYGCETMGDYIEIKLLETGQTIGHKQFKRNERDNNKIEGN